MYTSFAVAMAVHLGLDGKFPQTLIPSTRCQSPITSSIDPLLGDGVGTEARMARNRERTWLRILLWDRATNASLGRMHPILDENLPVDLDSWWQHPEADLQDKLTCACIMLRCRLASCLRKLRKEVALPHSQQHWLRDMVDASLEPWQRQWLPTPLDDAPSLDTVSFLFLRLVFMHGKLWTLALSLQGTGGPGSSSKPLQEDCFAAAVSCCEFSLKCLERIGEPLYCMHTPVWAMIAYAAVPARKLFPLVYGNRQGYEVELVALLAQLASHLYRSGTTPSHRFGMAAVFGQQLFLILRARRNQLLSLAGAPNDESLFHSHAVGEGESIPAEQPFEGDFVHPAETATSWSGDMFTMGLDDNCFIRRMQSENVWLDDGSLQSYVWDMFGAAEALFWRICLGCVVGHLWARGQISYSLSNKLTCIVESFASVFMDA